MARVGGEYPPPRINEGRRQLWLRDALDKAILPQNFGGPGPGRGLVMFSKPLPRFVIAQDRCERPDRLLFPYPAALPETRLRDLERAARAPTMQACGENGDGGRAAALNASVRRMEHHAQGWPSHRRRSLGAYGTIDWLFRQYKTEQGLSREGLASITA